MKKLLVASLIAGLAGAVWAGCTSQTVIAPSGKAMTCTTCCDSNNNCTTNCVGG